MGEAIDKVQKEENHCFALLLCSAANIICLNDYFEWRQYHFYCLLQLNKNIDRYRSDCYSNIKLLNFSLPSLIETFLGVGLTIGPAIGGVLYHFCGFAGPFQILGLVFIILCFPSAMLIPEASEGKENRVWRRRAVSYFKLLKNKRVVTHAMAAGVCLF